MYIGWGVLLWCFNHVTTQGEGPCYTTKGEEGKCVAINNCPYTKDIALLNKTEYPIICSFGGNVPMVCCVDANLQKPQRKHGEVSAKKCKEYYPFKKYFILVPGGMPSLVREFPHMAVIGFGDENNIVWQCGGSLISPNFILTAAHCLTSRGSDNARWVRIGDLDLSTDTDDAGPQQYAIKRRIPHPLYQRPARYHDIGLIELEKDVKLSQYVAYGCLDTERQHDEEQMIATGWGRTEFTGDVSSFLLKINLDLVPADECSPFYRKADQDSIPNGILDDLQVCAGKGKMQDTCQGDSGGPLQTLNVNLSSGIKVYDIVGVTSFGKACGLSNAPGIYTRVYNYLSWIEDIVWPAT